MFEAVIVTGNAGSHLFQRVASFLHTANVVSSLLGLEGSHLFQRVASFLLDTGKIKDTSKKVFVLISFREWLHSYGETKVREILSNNSCSHLFQRVASFLQNQLRNNK